MADQYSEIQQRDRVSKTYKKDGRYVKIAHKQEKLEKNVVVKRFTVEKRVMRVGTRYLKMCGVYRKTKCLWRA